MILFQLSETAPQIILRTTNLELKALNNSWLKLAECHRREYNGRIRTGKDAKGREMCGINAMCSVLLELSLKLHIKTRKLNALRSW